MKPWSIKKQNTLFNEGGLSSEMDKDIWTYKEQTRQ